MSFSIANRSPCDAPAYLTGVDENMLVFIREDVARKSDAERFAKIEALKKAVTASERAIDGVRRFLAQDTAPETLGSRSAKRWPGPGATGAA
jgi:hypothetical protein